jgi:hypothetical protein
LPPSNHARNANSPSSAAGSLRWAKRLTARYVEMAIQAAVREQRAAKFLWMDNQAMNFQKQFQLL